MNFSEMSGIKQWGMVVLGGAVVRVGSTVYDGSVREQLNRLREQLETE